MNINIVIINYLKTFNGSSHDKTLSRQNNFLGGIVYYFFEEICKRKLICCDFLNIRRNFEMRRFYEENLCNILINIYFKTRDLKLIQMKERAKNINRVETFIIFGN